MRGGWRKLLQVDLSDHSTEPREIEPSLPRHWLGGRGLGTKLLMNETQAGMDPLDPSAPIYFLGSPLMGTLAPGSNKLAAVFKGPVAGNVFVSLCGGHLGPAMRYAGWDGIIIEGRAEKPVILVIEDNRVELRDASEMWGMETGPAGEWIRRKWRGRDAQWALIGPAAERGVLFSSIHSGRGREFGRGGGGTLLGSRGLKAIVIVGTGGVPINDPVRTEELARRTWAHLAKDAKANVRKRWGTIELVSTINELGFWPRNNFQEGHLPTAGEIDANAYGKTVLAGHRSCHACPIMCGKIGQFRGPDGTVFELEGPEFESLTLLGPNIGLHDFHGIAEATRLCDELGMDTIQMGNVLGVVMEAAEKGILPRYMADGLDIGFGKPEAAFELIRRCASRQGELGEIMALGPVGAAEKLGAPELAIAVKGLGLPAYDPRGLKGLGLNYATAAEGASHMRGPTMGPEIGGGRRLEDSGKAEMVIDCQKSMALADSLGICSTARLGMTPTVIAEFMEAVTGEEWTVDELMEKAKKIITMERRFNIREGFTRKDDTLPKRFLNTAMTDGMSRDSCVDLDKMLDEYYDAMGWDRNGVPPDEV